MRPSRSQCTNIIPQRWRGKTGLISHLGPGDTPLARDLQKTAWWRKKKLSRSVGWSSFTIIILQMVSYLVIVIITINHLSPDYHLYIKYHIYEIHINRYHICTLKKKILQFTISILLIIYPSSWLFFCIIEKWVFLPVFMTLSPLARKFSPYKQQLGRFPYIYMYVYIHISYIIYHISYIIYNIRYNWYDMFLSTITYMYMYINLVYWYYA